MQAHYPERTYKIIIINAPWWFKTVYYVVSPFIDSRTRKKIHVHGKGYAKYLLEEISEDCLPISYGGKDKEEFGQSEIERKLLQHVDCTNKLHKVEYFEPVALLKKH